MPDHRWGGPHQVAISQTSATRVPVSPSLALRPWAFGLAESSIPAIVAGSRGSSRKTNPIALTDDEIAGILQASL
jgi:hypothetical protein